jgi:branched-chain amino acid transport system substrate-binding protein
MPTSQKAGAYSAVLHSLKAVAAAGTTETTAVANEMRRLPVDDFMTSHASLRTDSRLVRDMYLFEVKTPEKSTNAWDLLKMIGRVPADQAFVSPEASECPLMRDGHP